MANWSKSEVIEKATRAIAESVPRGLMEESVTAEAALDDLGVHMTILEAELDEEFDMSISFSDSTTKISTVQHVFDFMLQRTGATA